jgi:hypothetical protein
MTPRIEVEPGTGNFKILFRNPDDTTKWAYQIFEPATKIDIIVESTAKIDSNQFVYEYTIENLRTSRQNVASFAIELDTGIVRTCHVPLVGEWRCYLPTNSRSSVFFSGAFMSDRSGNIIKYVLAPGTRLSGFVIKSEAPPGIVYCNSRGRVDPQLLRVVGMDGEMVPDAIFRARPSPSEDRVRGRTIGPVRVPEHTRPEMFIDRIVSVLDTCLEEGWIGKRTVADQFYLLLYIIKAEIVKGNADGAKGTLAHLISLVEVMYQRGELLSEAYALLKYNTLYLTNRLLQ